ncbi:MAG: hypothetical protein JSW67_09125 [Candidatus Latescibacterota bacterium]|nr:MAG: hypothetical protein JSW67_09125 [Candidatus Latescibacterota bacterium]
MFDEKVAADQEVLGGQDLDQGWTVEGPSVNTQKDQTVVPPKPGDKQTPRVIQVDTAEAQELVNGIATAVGQVAGTVAPATAPMTLDLGGRPLHVPATESTNPKVRQAMSRMSSCRETYRNLSPEAIAEENADINRRLSQKYRTDCQLPAAGGAVSKSYYYDSKTIERLELDIKQVLLESDVPRSTIIEVCRLRDPEDQRALVFDILDKNLSCRETRQVVQLVVKMRSRPGTSVQNHLTPKLANLLRQHAPFFVRIT